MTLSARPTLSRRFLLHSSAEGVSSHPPYGLLASAGCKANIARAKDLMAAPMPEVDPPSSARHSRIPDGHDRSSSGMPLLRLGPA